MPKLQKTKLLIILFFAFVVSLVIAVFFVFHETNNQENLTCVSAIKDNIVQGESLSGIVEPEDEVRVLYDYYDCNDPERGDLVIIFYAGNENPLIKIIKGLPGDEFSFLPKDEGETWFLLVNGEILKNSEGEPYVLDRQGHQMLSLYESDYGGIIPEDSFLIMGNHDGVLDSSRFGLVSKADILGKAEKKQ